MYVFSVQTFDRAEIAGSNVSVEFQYAFTDRPDGGFVRIAERDYVHYVSCRR